MDLHNQPSTGTSHGQPLQVRQQDDAGQQKAAFINKLRELGANSYDLRLPETHSLPGLIKSDEHIEGIIYGRYRLTNGQPPGRGVLVATNRRILFVDTKPLYMRASEITYDVTSGITRSGVGMIVFITLNTRMYDINIRTFNRNCADKFLQAVEAHIFT